MAPECWRRKLAEHQGHKARRLQGLWHVVWNADDQAKVENGLSAAAVAKVDWLVAGDVEGWGEAAGHGDGEGDGGCKTCCS
jgi:hypothetical protein